MSETIPLKIRKSWREEVEVPFPITIVRHAVPYDAEGGGFDFGKLPEHSDEVSDDSNIM